MAVETHSGNRRRCFPRQYLPNVIIQPLGDATPGVEYVGTRVFLVVNRYIRGKFLASPAGRNGISGNVHETGIWPVL